MRSGEKQQPMKKIPMPSNQFSNLLQRYLLVIVLLSLVWTAEGRVRHHRWELEYQFKSPDCFQKLVITVNGQIPGPTIHAQQGDTVVVVVQNRLIIENAIHWHGIRQGMLDSSISSAVSTFKLWWKTSFTFSIKAAISIGPITWTLWIKYALK